MDIVELTWQALEQPLALGLVVLLLMLLLGNPLIHLLFSAGWRAYWHWQSRTIRPEPEAWPARSLAVNAVTLGVALALASWRLAEAEAGAVFITALVAFAMAIGGYEPLRNALRALGIDFDALNWGRASPSESPLSQDTSRYTYP